MTSQSKRDTGAVWLLSGLACLPLLLYATLGWHTRLIHDDFHYAAIGLEKGAWGGLLHYYQHWTSGYSSVLFKTALAAHAVYLPPIVTSLVVLLGALGSAWLIRQCCALLSLDLPRPLALGSASLLVAAAINAFYTLEPFYWYAANIQYTVPLVCLLLCLGLALSTARGAGSGRRLRWGSLVCGAACFLTAGASEMFLVFQLAFLLPLAGLAYVIAPAGRRRSLSIVALAMLLASLLSALVQLASPGIWNRAARDALNYAPPIRHLPALAEITLRMTFESIGRPEVIAGYSLLCSLGLALGMRTGHGRHNKRDGLWLIAIRRARAGWAGAPAGFPAGALGAPERCAAGPGPLWRQLYAGHRDESGADFGAAGAVALAQGICRPPWLRGPGQPAALGLSAAHRHDPGSQHRRARLDLSLRVGPGHAADAGAAGRGGAG